MNRLKTSITMMALVFKLLIIHSFTIGYTFSSLEAQQYCCPSDDNIETQEFGVEAYVYLEGAYDNEEELMRNKLNKLGYLPGQNPKTFFSKKTNSGHPYKKDPWSYNGTEGFVNKNEFYSYSKEVVDWVLLSIRKNESPLSTVYKAPGFVLQDGTIQLAEGAPKCMLNPKESYYIIIEHRNHLAVMSNVPVRTDGNVITYDFRYSAAYLEGHKEIKDGVFAMIAGNADAFQNEITQNSIDEDDLKAWEGGNGLNSSYFMQDVDLSGDVSIKDKEILHNNMGLISTVPQ